MAETGLVGHIQFDPAQQYSGAALNRFFAGVMLGLVAVDDDALAELEGATLVHRPGRSIRRLIELAQGEG